MITVRMTDVIILSKPNQKEIFLEFFEEPKDSDRRKHEGIYTSYMYETNGKKLQVILLDVRNFS